MRDRLLTILFTDVEGSTALHSARGDAEARDILRACDELVRQEVQNHGGQPIKSLGDGLMASFDSPSRGLACAVAVQSSLTERGWRQPREEVRVRLGLHTGEVAEEAGDLFGAAVNAAARIAARCKGGEILVSEVVRQLCGGAVEGVLFEDRGRVSLKGFPERWRLYRVISTRADLHVSAIQRTPFVGREKERAELRTLVDQSLGGQGGLVMIGGEPGVGKTRLGEEIAAEGLRCGFRVFTGHCYEAEADHPYMPWVEIIETAARDSSPATLREALGDSAPELARVVPELRQLFPDIPPPVELPPDQQRRYTFSSIREYAIRAARIRPQLYVLEDLHWADEPTLLFLEHLTERLHTIPCLIIGTYRDPPIEVSPVLADTLAALVRRRQARLVNLKRHSEAEVRAMLRALSGHTPPPQVTAAIYAETEGNAFFVEEVYRHLADMGRLLDERGRFRTDLSIDELDVPENVRLVTGRRLDRLGEATRRLLLVAAVVGRRSSFQLLRAVGELSGDALLDALEEAEQARVMFTESSPLQTHHWFAHELIRQTLLTRLTPPRRKHLHLRVADALEGLRAADLDRHAAEIAHHLVEAGELADGERTARYLTMAAQRSLAGAAFEDALRHLSNALAVLPAHPTRQRADLLGRVGLAQRCLCRWQDAVATWDEAVAVLEALSEVEAAADLAWEYCFHLAWQYQFDDVLAVAQRALSALGDRGSPQRIRLLAISAVGFGIKGDVAEASARIEEASRLAESDGDPRLLGEVGVVQTVHHDIFMQVREILPAGERAANMLREAGAVWHLADVLCFVDLGLVFQGRFDESDAVVAEVEPLAERTGHYAAASVLRRNGFPKLAARTANLRGLEELADVQFAVSTEMDSPVWLAYAHAMRGITRIWRGDWEAARVDLDAGARLAAPGMWFGPQHGLLLLLHALLGERNQTWALLDSLDLPRAGTANPIGAWTLGILAAEAVSILGAEQRACALHPLVAEALATGCLLRQYDGALIQRVAGMTAATAGLARSAEEHFETALRQAEELPHLMERPQVCHSYARFLIERGGREDQERARDLLERAIAGYRGIGMQRHEAMARELLHSV